MLQRQNHLLLSDCDGPRRLVSVCDNTEEMRALDGGAMVIATLAPTPAQRWDAYAEGRRIEVEEVRARAAAPRVRRRARFLPRPSETVPERMPSRELA